MPNAPTIPLEIGNYLKEEKKRSFFRGLRCVVRLHNGRCRPQIPGMKALQLGGCRTGLAIAWLYELGLFDFVCALRCRCLCMYAACLVCRHSRHSLVCMHVYLCSQCRTCNPILLSVRVSPTSHPLRVLSGGMGKQRPASGESCWSFWPSRGLR